MVTGSELVPVAATEELAVGAAVMVPVAAVLVVDPLPLPLPLPDEEVVVAVAVFDWPAVCDGEVPTSVWVELDWPPAPELVPGTIVEPVEGTLEGTGALDCPPVDEAVGMTGLLVEGSTEAEGELD
jgi:hypothetical protein